METKIIDEQLEDKQQIVTYKYLSQKLAIHPNKAKQLLKDYVTKLSDDKKYSITIIIGGILKENDEFCIVLAYNDHVETLRRRFKNIDFEHFYSIQPVSRFSDIDNALYLVDSSENNYANLPSSIKNKEKGIMSIPEENVKTPMEIDVPLVNKTKATPNIISNHSNETVVKTKLDKTNKKNNKLDLLTENNKNNKIKPKETEEKIVPKKTNSNFFTNFKKSNNSDNTKADIKQVSTENVIIEHKKKKDAETPMPKENAPEEHLNNKHVIQVKRKSLKKKSNEIKSTKKVKRKRIQTFDSTDEEIDSEEEDKKRSENVMEVDEIDIVQPTPPRPTIRENRKKEKQIITSTFLDDDGFVCTTKEVKLVEVDECLPSETVENVKHSEAKELNIQRSNEKPKSCKSNAEVQKEKEKKPKNKPSKNNNSTLGMKQSSLTSFFKTK